MHLGAEICILLVRLSKLSLKSVHYANTFPWHCCCGGQAWEREGVIGHGSTVATYWVQTSLVEVHPVGVGWAGHHAGGLICETLTPTEGDREH